MPADKQLTYPYLRIDLDKIEANARLVTDLCREQGIALAGVTKATCGMPKVARALLRGGVQQLADSRLDHLRRLRNDGIQAELLLLRSPGLSELEQVVELVDISLNSELRVIKALSDAARKRGKVQRIVLMVDLGDLREGILPRETAEYVEQILACGGVELIGLGANLACLGGIQPTSDNLGLLVYLAEEIRRRFALPLPLVSGGNSFSLPLLLAGGLPAGINHLRLGASLLLAGAPTPANLQERLHRDAFTLHAEVLEVKTKPSRPYGESGPDAFGRRPVFDAEEHPMQRAVLGIGRADTVAEELFPTEAGLRVLGASSDHLLVDVTASPRKIRVGGELTFTLEYGALLRGMTSPAVRKYSLLSPLARPEKPLLRLLGIPLAVPGETAGSIQAPDYLRLNRLVEQLAATDYELCDSGDLAPKALRLTCREREQLISARARQCLAAGEVPLFVGGPPASLPGILSGIAQAVDEFGVICFHSRGAQLAAGLGEQPGRRPLAGLANHVLVGVRQLTMAEKHLLEQAGVTLFTIDNLDRCGIVAVMERALAIAGTGSRGLHVSLDMAVVDSREAPGVSNAEPGGVSYRETHLAMEMIAERGRLLSADISGIVPENDRNSATARFAISLLASLLGRKVAKAEQSAGG